MSLTYLPDALDALVDALPGWWAQRDDSSILSGILRAEAVLMDDLAQAVETIYADQALATATANGLIEWAHLYGADNEQLSPTLDVMRAYLQARAEEDGSIESLERTLLALLNNGLNVPAPTSGSLTFPDDGSGLTFPSDGSGLTFPDADLIILQNTSAQTVEVQVRTTLVFDRAAFARAVARFRPAHIPPITITEF